ncbi:IS1380 family transposase [Niveibacterium sp.]|uniref:IS1380 family transposase n=1 Tax=Niveibacterium sp. TaxID=2017444 RepID=UPI002CB7863B|nr:IS1380 family transposase [Piscinibacter sp.]HNN34796.1 IS1380 family transposase [Ottowia sp.]HNO41438.1 IS1380 family transposase [Ottowia sp.]
MPAFTIKQLSCDLTPVAGLSLVGHHLSRLAPVLGRIDAALPVRTGVATSDIVRAYVGLLVQGKSDFDAIENYRGDTFYKQSLGISLLASSATLRQRMDAAAAPLLEHAPALIETLLAQARPEFGTLACGWLPLDIDAFVMDNSDTAKQGVGRTYTGVDGYCPLAAYLGTKGYCLALQLREGQQHSARGTPEALRQIAPIAQRLSAAGGKAPILARLDAGFDSAEIMAELAACNKAAADEGLPRVDWLIKWNPRKAAADVATLVALLEGNPATVWSTPREGKRVTVWNEQVHIEGFERPQRRVMRLVERTIDARGQRLIEPSIELQGWTTSLRTRQFDAQQIIALYEGHGAHEQFHSEFKTDLDLQRLPSGKFATNELVCALAALAMNILRLLGEAGLHGEDAPVRHAAKRRRIKTVIQELIYRAARLIRHGRRLALGLGANDRSASAFARLHAQLALPGCG